MQLVEDLYTSSVQFSNILMLWLKQSSIPLLVQVRQKRRSSQIAKQHLNRLVQQDWLHTRR